MPPRKRRSRGYIEELPSGSFRAVVFAGHDPLTGKERRLRETAATHAAAKKALTKLQGQVDEDRQPKSSITVRQAVEQWLDVAELADTTRERYDDLIRLYVMPTFGHLQAAKIDAELLERYYARLHRCREMCTGRQRADHVCRPLSSSTTRKIPLHPARRARTGCPMATPDREQSVHGRGAGPAAHRARPAERRRGRTAAECRLERSGVGTAAVAHHAHRAAAR